MPYQADAQSVSLSLDQAVAMALQHDWTLKRAEEQRRTVHGEKLSARAQLLPSITPNASETFSGSNVQRREGVSGGTATMNPRHAVGVSVSQPIWNGSMWVQQDRYKLREQYVEEDIRLTRQQLIAAVQTAYYEILYQNELVDIAEEQVSLAKELLDKTQKRFEADDVPELDVLRSKVEVQTKEADLISTRNDLVNARAVLLRRIGLPLHTDLHMSDALTFTDYQPHNEAGMMAYAELYRPEIQTSRLQEKINEKDILIARADLLPTLSFSGSYGATNARAGGTNKMTWTQSWSTGIDFRWSFGGLGMSALGAIRRQQAALRMQQYASFDTLESVQLDVKQALLNLNSSIQVTRSQRETVAQAKRVLDQQTIRWEEGAGSYLDVIDARSSYALARQTYWRGVFGYRAALVALDLAQGKTGEADTHTQVKGHRVTRISDREVEDAFNSFPVLPAEGSDMPEESSTPSMQTPVRDRPLSSRTPAVRPAEHPAPATVTGHTASESTLRVIESHTPPPPAPQPVYPMFHPHDGDPAP